MTSPAPETTATAAAKPASRWEDFMDIFYAPTSVYERRKDQSPWPTDWIVTLLVTLVTVFTFPAIAPVRETELRHAFEQRLAKNPSAQVSQDVIDKQIDIQMKVGRFTGIFFPIGVLVGALFVWIVAKIVGTGETWHGALVVVTYATIIGALNFIVMGVQGLMLNVSNMTNSEQLSLSVARFMDKAATSPMLFAVAKQIDVFAIWGLVVTAIGVRVTANASKNQAIIFAVVWFVAATLLTAGFARLSG